MMKKGFTLIEVLVSLTILGMLAAAIFPVVGWLVTKSAQYKYDSQAAEILQEGTEAAYNIMLATTDWSALPAGNLGQSNTPLHVEQVVAGGDTFGWTFAIDKVKVNGQFERWTEISSVCRNPVSGERIECTDPSTVDLNSRLITTFVTWSENGLPKTTKSELLVVKI